MESVLLLALGCLCAFAFLAAHPGPHALANSLAFLWSSWAQLLILFFLHLTLVYGLVVFETGIGFFQSGRRGRSAGCPAGRPGGARVVRGQKKNAGGPGGCRPLAKPVKGGVWGGEAPPAKLRGVWGPAPPSQNRKIFEKFSIFIVLLRSII